MRKFKFSKLVRDKIVEQIISNNNRPNWRKLTDSEYIQELKNKIVEEAIEVPKTKNSTEVVMELADIQEVIDNLLKILKVSKKEFSKIQKTKNLKAGSFKNKQYIESVEVNSKDTEWLNYYLVNPDKYPEIKK